MFITRLGIIGRLRDATYQIFCSKPQKIKESSSEKKSESEGRVFLGFFFFTVEGCFMVEGEGSIDSSLEE